MLAIAVALLLSQSYPPGTPSAVVGGVDQQGNAHPTPSMGSGALGIAPTGTPLFKTRIPYFNGQLSYSASVGPLVGDGGTLGVFTPNYTASTVSCYQVQPGGLLSTPVNTTVTGNPRFAALGDFNEDGITDFAVTNRTANVQVFFGSGNCNFKAGPVVSTDGGTAGQGIIAVKLAAQTHQSLVVADRSTSLVSIFVGGGDGGFLTPAGGSSAAFGGCSGAGAYQLTAADLNNDGNVDVVMPCNGTNFFNTLFGAPDGGFATAVQTAIRSTDGTDAIALGDFNGDGVMDAVTASLAGGATESVAVELFLGEAQYSSETSNLFQFITPSAGFAFNSGHQGGGSQGIGAGKFFGDGRVGVVADVAQSPSSPIGVQFFPGYGNGQLDNTLGVTSLISKAQGQPVWTNTHLVPIYLTVADLNGDGIDDVVVANFGDGTTGAGIPNLWTILSSGGPESVVQAEGSPFQVTGSVNGNMGSSPGPAVTSYVNCQSAYGTYLGVLPHHRSIAVQTQYDTGPIWVGQYNVTAAPTLPFSISDAGFSDGGPGAVGTLVQPGAVYSLDVDNGPAWYRPPGQNLQLTEGLFCVKLSGAQDGTWDGGWTQVTELP